MPLNFANIIALPLLLGIGVAFDIYFVMNWRAGRPHPLQSGTARAVVFSTLTTASAFGSLMLSSHPGTAEMGKLLSLELFYTLLCVLLVMPALLAHRKRSESHGCSARRSLNQRVNEAAHRGSIGIWSQSPGRFSRGLGATCSRRRPCGAARWSGRDHGPVNRPVRYGSAISA